MAYLLLTIVGLSLVNAQSTLTGKVSDDSGEPIQFAYVYINGDSTNSYFTDIGGNFNIQRHDDLNDITIEHVDFQIEHFQIGKSTPDSLYITMQIKDDLELAKLMHTLDSSGLSIIKKVIANKRLHDPEKQGGSFRYNTYSKSTIDLVKIKSHKISKRFENVIENDSTFQKHHRLTGVQHVELAETMTERYYNYPNKDYEKVLGFKETGLHDRQLMGLNANQHPISFYGNYFDFLGSRYSSPIGPVTYQKYDFYEKDIYYTNKDTVFVIAFKPKKLRTTGLEGVMYIHSNQYAVQNIVVKPNYYDLVDFKIAQRSNFIDSAEWFPTQINYLYFVDQFPKKYLGTVYEKNKYIKNIELNPKVDPANHKVELVLMDHFASQQDEDFWSTHRIEPLSKREKRTYLRVDSLRHKSTPANIFKRISAFYKEDLYYQLPFMTLNNLFRINRFEGLRTGLGGKIGKDYLKVFEFNGYGAYGFRDKKWKWGAGGGFFLNEKHEVELMFLHRHDIEEPGAIDYLNKDKDLFRAIFTDRMDNVETNEIALNFRSLGYHLFEIGAQTIRKEPAYDYQFLNTNEAGIPTSSNSFKVTEILFKTRYAINEKVTNMFGNATRLNTLAPILYLNYSRGLSGVAGGEYDYNKWVGLLDYQFHIGHMGRTDITLEAGTIDGDLPYPFLFNGKGGNLSTSSVIIQDHFQTMGLYEYVSDRFLNIFFSHDFGSKIFAHARFRPDILVYHHMGWGVIDHPERHLGTALVPTSYDEGYVESGLGFNNILKYKLFGKVYGGLGLSFFYRYGPHENPGGFRNNFAYRITYVIRSI